MNCWPKILKRRKKRPLSTVICNLAGNPVAPFCRHFSRFDSFGFVDLILLIELSAFDAVVKYPVFPAVFGISGLHFEHGSDFIGHLADCVAETVYIGTYDVVFGRNALGRLTLYAADGRQFQIHNGQSAAEKKENWLNRKLTADKKPYFMQYIYPAEKAKMKEYNKKTNEKSLLRFRMTLEELLAKDLKTPEEETFINCYLQNIPLGTAPCTINKICWRIEEIFGQTDLREADGFDYSILKSSAAYTKPLYAKIQKIYDLYKRELSAYMQYAGSERIKSEDRQMQKYLLKEAFKRQCLEQCPNEDILCNIVLDLCYAKSASSKQFAWDICGDLFIRNLLRRNDYMISYPSLDENGEIEYDGLHFTMRTAKIKTEDEKCQLS